MNNRISSESLRSKFSRMYARCYKPANRNYHSYGGRGIVICRLWKHHPERFVAWAIASGWRSEFELDRIDPFGPYAPWNCRWLTREEHLQLTAKANRSRGFLLVYRTPTRHRKYKLSRNDVLYIHAHPEKSSQVLADELGVNRRTIWNVRCGGTWVEYHPVLGNTPQKRDWSCKKRISWRPEVSPPKIQEKSEYSLRRERTISLILQWRDYLYSHASMPYAELAATIGLPAHILETFISGKTYKELWLNGVPPQRTYKAGIPLRYVKMIYLSQLILSHVDCSRIMGISRFVIMNIRLGKTHTQQTAALAHLPFYSLLPVELLSRESFLFWESYYRRHP